MVRADNLTVTFRHGFLRRKLNALSGFSLAVNEGDIFALLGPNGAGKSTAMYCFLGLIRPNAGSLSVMGTAPERGGELFRQIAYLPEEPHYHDYLSVEEAVRYYANLHGERISDTRVLRAIERVGLTEHRGLRVSKCSKGMKQKIGIAQCIVKKPRLLFLDEPTRGLDPLMVREFRNILLELNRNGTTVVLNSHVLSEIETVCNRVAIMDRGRVIAQDTLENLAASDSSRYNVKFSLPQDAGLPEYYTETRAGGKGPRTGEVPAAMFGDFVRTLESGGGRLYDCSLKRESLEDLFHRVVREAKSS